MGKESQIQGLGKYRWTGLFISLSFIASWLLFLIFLFSSDLQFGKQLYLIPLNIFFIAFLFSGLFINGHDGFHGMIAPDHPRLNQFVGQLSLGLYGGFAYEALRKKHLLHHAHPATELDPDFHDGQNVGFWSWYIRFMNSYVGRANWMYYFVTSLIFVGIFQVPFLTYAIGFGIPAAFSLIQLFYFCTYQTHGYEKDGFGPERTKSLNMPWLVSLLTCFHFGYHFEHHFKAKVPWWQLPKLRKYLAE